MTYSLRFRASVRKDVRRIPHAPLTRIQAALRMLQSDPFPAGCTKLYGYDQYYRIRVGRYRIIYEVTKEIRIVTIIRIGHRRDVYRLL